MLSRSAHPFYLCDVTANPRFLRNHRQDHRHHRYCARANLPLTHMAVITDLLSHLLESDRPQAHQTS
jgi:hypothetical protein